MSSTPRSGTETTASDAEAATADAGVAVAEVAAADATAGFYHRARADLAYEERTVVDALDLDVPDGRVTVIVGPNACGKSTTLRALGRLPQAARRGRAPRRHRAVEDPHPEDRPVDRTAAADPGGPGGDHRRRPRRPGPSAASALVAAVVGGGRAGGEGRDGAYGHHRARRPLRGRALRRSAPAGLDRDGARPGDRSAAARRADHVPRHRAPGGGPGPGAPASPPRRRTAPAAGPSSPCSTTSTRPPGTRTTWSP